MTVNFMFALTILLIGSGIGICDENDLTDVIKSIFTIEPNVDPTDYLQSTSPATVEKEIKSSSGKSCGLGQKCVRAYLCSNGKKITDGGVKLFNVRIDNDDTCSFLEKCCSVEDTISDRTSRKIEIPTKCGIRNKIGVGFEIEGATKHEAQFGEFPWMLAILRGRNDLDLNREIYQCGGSLIHPQVVLTAAHCVYGRKPIAFKVRAGEWETNTKNELYPDQSREVMDMVIHPDYNKGNLYNDIALLFLTSPFELAPHVNTVCLPPPGYNFDFSLCYATGWGKDQFENGKYQNILKKIDLPVVPSYVCQDNLRNTLLGKYFELHRSFLCAGGERGKDTCEGDGGSPLSCPIDKEDDQFYQAGIVAWGIGCGKENVPGVYVNVAQFRKWIDEELAFRSIVVAEYKPR